MRPLSKRIFVTLTFTALLAGMPLVIAACGGGGGGGGASSVVEGNISQQVGKASFEQRLYAKLKRALSLINVAHASISGVEVSVRGTDVATLSDELGFFRLEGDFGGEVVLDFVLPEAIVSLGLKVDRGTRIMLQDITINVSTGEAQAAETVMIDEAPSSGSSSSSSSSSGNSNESGANENGDGSSNANESGSESNANEDNGNDANSNESTGEGNSNEAVENENESGTNSNESAGGSNENTGGSEMNENTSSGSGGSSNSNQGAGNENGDDGDDNDNDDDDDNENDD